ncbi:hypothetical protein N8A98_05205 [Devosia neptuniae]|uniref:Uncharacterized protein n=1 Tax=Devosia neptuniae TaxID=191302 RepID=A0ABY6CEC3_9HYPH|nr:hypothetical protein [Devosia neptuniae]UXN70593.1 hypothetical protein N8A98_05205 [Devosia neptuniae]
MTTPRTVTHSDGTTFSDGTGYAPTDLLVSDEWPANPSALPVEHQVSVLARAVLVLAEGRRPSGAMKRFARALATGRPA